YKRCPLCCNLSARKASPKLMERRRKIIMKRSSKQQPPRTGRGVNKSYFTQLLQDRDLSQRGLAKLMHLDQSSLVRAFQGKRKFKTQETAQLARILNVPLEEVLRNLDVEVPMMRLAKGGTVAVTGQVVASKVQFGRPAGPRTVAAPPNETGEGLQALRYSDEGPLEGAYLYFRPAVGVPVEAIGRLCVCTIQGGEVLLASLRHGSRRATYTLRDLAGRVLLEDAWIESAAPVVWIKTV